jgi:hypothetical protein
MQNNYCDSYVEARGDFVVDMIMFAGSYSYSAGQVPEGFGGCLVG